LPNKTIDLLQGLDVLVLDALRTDPHPTHFSLEEAMAMADKLGAKQTYFTHVSHEFDFETTNRRLPSNRQLAFDGQRIRLT
jgi:phosphoribosyl 1,2-cyclic phosphate phosphodiesterase